MKMSKSNRYYVSTASIAVLLFLAFRYYQAANAPHDRSGYEQTLFVLWGITLFVAAGVAVITQAYYVRYKDRSADETAEATELHTLGALRSHKSIEVTASITSEQYAALKKNGTLELPLNFVQMPVRVDDTAVLRKKDSSQSFTTKITKIDGYHQVVSVALPVSIGKVKSLT